MEIADALKSLRLHWRFSVGIMLLAVIALAAFLYTRKTVRPPNTYSAAVDLVIPAIDSKGIRPNGVPGTLLQGQSQLALSKATEARALDNAKVPTRQRGSIEFAFASVGGGGGTNECTGTSCSDVVTLSATARGPKLANTVASAFATSYVTARTEVVASGATSQQADVTAALDRVSATLSKTNKAITDADPLLLPRLPRAAVPDSQQATATLPPGTPEVTILLVVQRNALLAQAQSLRESYAQASITALLPSSYASRLQTRSAVKITPPPPSPLIPIVAILGVGLALALGIPILRDRLDRSLRTPKAASAAFGATVLTVLPPVSRRLQHSVAPPGTPVEEAYRALAATAVATDRLPRAIVVTSPTGTMQDMVAANFGTALAGLGLRVALVATNARQDWFLEGQPPDATLGFPELVDLAHQGQLDGSLARGLVKTAVENLYVVTPGTANGEVGLDGLRPLLEALSAHGVDVSVIAGPALLEDPNATIFAWTTRSVLWAFEAGHTSEAEAKEAAARLALAGASPFGVVMVGARHS